MSARIISLFAVIVAAASSVVAADRGKLVDLSCEELFSTGAELLQRAKRADARTYLRRYEQRCPREADIEQAKLKIAVSYFEEGSIDLRVEGVATCRQIISYYPNHHASCECQLLIADYHFKQMRACDRDSSATRDAVREFERLLSAYPDCDRIDEGRTRLAAARDRLACAEFEVGEYYRRIGADLAAAHRYADLLRDFPDFTRGCEVARRQVEALSSLGDAEGGRTALGWMSERCAGTDDLAKASRAIGVAPTVDSAGASK